MHIVISGYYGYDNVGDEAILLSIIASMRKHEPDIQFTVLSANPEGTMKTFGVQAINRFDFKKIYNVIKGADGLISGGGSLIQDETGWRSVPYYIGIIQIARWLRKPVFVYAQGMGPINQFHNKQLTRWALNRVDVVTVRDGISKQLLEDIGVSREIHVVPDPVLGLEASSFGSDWLREVGVQDYIAVSVRDWNSAEPFKEKIAASLDKLVERGFRVVLVPMHGKDDEVTSREIVGMMEHEALVAPHQLSIEEKIALIGQARMLIGIRLHSLIFAALNHTPFVAISYDPKIDAFASIFDQPVVGHVGNDDWDSESLLSASMAVLENEAELRVRIGEKAVQFYQDAVRTSEMACELFRSSGK